MAPEMDEQEREPNQPISKSLARVHIYGAGIAGLTAAHELAIRGFRVRVIEPAQECDEAGRLEGAPHPLNRRMAVGGLARTQFMRAERGAAGNFLGTDEDARSDEGRMFLKYPENFEPGGRMGEVPDEAEADLHHFLNRCGFFTRGETQGVLHLRVPPGKNDAIRKRRRRNAEALHRLLTATNTWDTKLEPARVIILEEAEAQELAQCLVTPPLPLEDKEGLQLELVHFLPGEHGFRFFPSYYRHLFSTMMETPILDEDNRLTGRRVFDNLVPSSFYGIAAQGRRIRFLRRAPSTRPVQMLQELKDLAASGYPATDTLQFTLRIWRYMSTCSERRKADYEKLSWWEYLEGFDPKANTRRYQYSDAFKRDMQSAPRVLAAFDGAWGDARTNGNTFVQLYLNNLLPLPKTDGTLNGPTTLAWLRPWRRYLRDYLKVEFHAGALTRLELEVETGRLKPFWRRKGESQEEEDTRVTNPPLRGGGHPAVVEKVDYHIIATDAAAAEAVTRDLPPIGVIQGLRGFTTTIPPNPRGPEPEQPRPADVFPGNVPWDRFQTLTGIQFFFPASVRLAEGYIYFLDAPWGLSAINSQQYWATPPTFDRDGFGAVLSVDIGNWFVREEGKKSPSRSSHHEIADEVWRQIKQATELHKVPLPNSAQFDFSLPAPSWYHVDRNIRFKRDKATGEARPVANLAPYLIPIVGDWDRRPGTEPWDPLRSPPPPKLIQVDGLWLAEHGGYPVHWNKLVFAGTYLKTFTRMTTMESANESARHAVNAIIDHYLAHHEVRSRDPGPQPLPAPGGQSDELGPLAGLPEFRMTPIGEYCRIWDPEQHELPELAPLRELDAKLFAEGRPHVWDVLNLEALARPFAPSLGTPGGAEPLLELLRKVREGLETLLKARAPGTR
ncbi:NAD(P)-binding protein [Pyxidicoccus caerfyrddinensis]|uniref:NAD(P)-binding protein n=1 Tax=Pyxidicoccus caerfyrddinensis TaxID=2709663 RepID=UPI0013D968AD|nr:FAD/NAD(P)-binding protein [Pyxidicoccus caerfyrddinensis]